MRDNDIWVEVYGRAVEFSDTAGTRRDPVELYEKVWMRIPFSRLRQHPWLWPSPHPVWGEGIEDTINNATRSDETRSREH